MNKIKSFTLYREVFKLIDTVKPKEKRDSLLGKVCDYYYKDIEPEFEENSYEETIWENISKPIKKYKNNALNGLKGGRPKDEEETEDETQQETETITQNLTQTESTSNDVIVNVNSNCNCLNNINNLDIIKQVIDYLNNKTNSNYKYKTKTTQQKINARLNEGYVLDDFIDVIDKKYNEWRETEFEQYLCPETLFGTKFEKYLNQKSKKKKLPDWLDKEIESKELSEEELRELEERW